MLNLTNPKKIMISREDLEKMRLDVESKTPEEACGLLAGIFETDRCRVMEVIPTVNALHSPFRYRLDPKEQLDVFSHIESQGLDLIGIYHSHPSGPAWPSNTDVAEAYYPEVVYLIWSRSTIEWECRGFTIRDGEIEKVSIVTEIESG
jgi:[CysO sulfur-carrier protein]-S-L-cysteine hydrolase